MKRSILIAFFFLGTALAAMSLPQDSTNVTDAEGRKQGRWVIYNKMKKPPLPEFTDDQKVEEGKFIDDKKTGKWITYYPNGNMKSVITYENNRPNGYATLYHENGKILEQGYWKNQRWVGDYKSYHENGEVQHEFKFNDQGKRDGKQAYYADNGQKIIEGVMSAGKEVGTWEEWYDNGDKRADKVFNEGTLDATKTVNYEPKKPIETAEIITPKSTDAPKGGDKLLKVSESEKPNPAVKSGPPFDGNGDAKLFNKNKQISKDGFFVNYKLKTGKQYLYDDNGILQRIAVYENFKYVGDAPLPVD